MAKEPRKQQQTDARRVGEKGTGKLDRSRSPAPPARRRKGAGGTSGRPAIEDQTAAVREELRRQRDAAIRELREQGVVGRGDEPANITGPGSVLDDADQAQVSLRHDMAMMRRERLAARVNQLTAALERLDRGDYGRCTRCGRPIEPGRLAALPEARTCRECQERVEQGERGDQGAAA
ncbi:MAG TPA: TraR/DksA family transcriptional regulator [Candidatus Tectomicrobia bacterium]|nr:TraR/DksA family transcriptional regulator [Candidatus Tectomicrobia bacterium]